MPFTIHRGGNYNRTPPHTFAINSPQPNQLCAYFTGFTANPDSSKETLRICANQFQRMYPGGDFLVWAWDKYGWWSADDVIKECDDFLKTYRAGNSRGPYTSLMFGAHSYGGDFLHTLLNWLATNAPDIEADFAAFYDQVPSPLTVGPWMLPPNVKMAMQFLQHNGLGWFFPIGPNGTPFPAVSNLSTTNYPVGTPNMDHVKIVAASWPKVLAAMQGAIK